ncbi:MAG: hypothetical protein AB1424_12300 [Thermodesulfobacteriota bacterium]
MELDKWVKLRIILVGLGIGILFVVILVRFVHLMATKSIGLTFLIISIVILLLIVIIYNYLKELNLRTSNIYNSVESLDKYIIEQSIDEIISNNKLRKSAVTYFILFISCIVFILVHTYYPSKSFNLVTAFILFVMMILFINNSILEYRISKGYYGSNDHEAREIINFILTLPSNTDFRNGAAFKNLYQIQEDRVGELLGENIDKIRGPVD